MTKELKAYKLFNEIKKRIYVKIFKFKLILSPNYSQTQIVCENASYKDYFQVDAL